MNNATVPSDAALTAAETARRLLASTPPPMAASAASTGLSESDGQATSSEEAGIASGPGQSNDLLARLRMPGKSGPIPVPTPRPAAPIPAIPDPPGPTAIHATLAVQ